MNDQRLEAFRQQLLHLRARLRGDVSRMASVALANVPHAATPDTAPAHSREVVSDVFEQEFAWSIIESEEHTVKLIDEAIERLRAGQYGICQSCQRNIPQRRLEVLPYTPYCVQCAAIVRNY